MRFGNPLTARATTAGVIIASFVFSLAIDLPGHISYDSVIQLLEGRIGQYANWHPPVMSWLLGLGDAVLSGTALYVVVVAALGFGTFLLVLFLVPKPSWLACGLLIILALSPQLLIYQGIVWKDVLFANATVAAFGCMGHAAVSWDREPRRLGWLALAAVLLALCGLARQNGIVVMLVGGAAAGFIAAAKESRPLRQGLLHAAAVLVAAGLIAGAANLFFSTRIVGSSGPGEQIERLEVYDLTGAVAHDPGIRLDVLAKEAPDLEREIRTDGVRLFSPTRNDTLAGSQPLQDALDDVAPDTLRRQWIDLIVHHPLRYLAIRAELFAWVWLTPDISKCAPYDVGVDGPAGEMKTLGLQERWDDRDDALDSYAKSLLGTPVFSHLFFTAIALFAGVLLFLRRRPADLAIGFLLAAAATYTATLFVISIACDYRYLYVDDLAAMIALFYLALEPRSWIAFVRNRRWLAKA